jgi:hypothetical protein
MASDGLYSVYVLAIIVGCLVVTFVCYSIDYIGTNGFRDNPREREMSTEQKEYMRNLRYRNILSLLEQTGHGKGRR